MSEPADLASTVVPPDSPVASPDDPVWTRRRLLRGGVATAAATVVVAGLTGLAPEAAVANEAELPPAMRSPRHPFFDEEIGIAAAGLPARPPLAVIALNRMGFGPRPGDLRAFHQLANSDDARLTKYVDQQLNPASIDDSACDAILAAHNFQHLNKPLTQLWSEFRTNKVEWWRPAAELERATLLRAVYSKRQLVEVLADHWHNHFNVYGWDYWIAPTLIHYDRDVIRRHMLGNFRKMLEAVAQSPAMLFYLDNQSNSGGRPNENYARELFELHAMGAENYLGVRAIDDPTLVDETGKRRGYIDEDVYGATTCFTGWRINTDTGLFAFDESSHFPYAKLVLGEIIPAAQGIKDGHDVLDLLVEHPGTARHVCRRLCRRLISDNPPERVVQAAADVFMATRNADNQLAQVVRTILLSPEFRTTWGEKIKRPLEYSISLLRALNANFSPIDNFFWSYDSMGQGLFDWRPPDGYPDDRRAWTGTMGMLQRWRHCNYLFGWKIGGDGADKETPRLRPENQTPADIRTPNGLVDFWAMRILGRNLPPEERTPIVNFMASGRNPDYALPDDQYQDRLRQMVALICMSPSFQWR